ncbi:hypothetical protein EY643_08990 [Halioglobus maricola]|uniref:TonB-dependent receptor n=1 Tax=Halioglobus maricola TaxID=2601894 RepID=A0A5P9NIU4_9GAMM|nr:hypothetical protein [Halioglobus maricola]QFU75783.1 hypothetical protein EY643_08990 [Halioglobus maricola]
MKNKFRIATMAAAVAATGSGALPATAQQLEEVVVTAQRRVENMQDVAIAVTSVSGDQMDDARVFNIENIKAVSLSISFNKTNIPSSSANIQIRGIGTTGNARTFEGAIFGTYCQCQNGCLIRGNNIFSATMPRETRRKRGSIQRSVTTECLTVANLR